MTLLIVKTVEVLDFLLRTRCVYVIITSEPSVREGVCVCVCEREREKVTSTVAGILGGMIGENAVMREKMRVCV